MVLFLHPLLADDTVEGRETGRIERLREAAEQGVAEAQYSLGAMYDKGDGVPEDDFKAVKWYRKAAEQGLAEAQCDLSGMYILGLGVPKARP